MASMMLIDAHFSCYRNIRFKSEMSISDLTKEQLSNAIKLTKDLFSINRLLLFSMIQCLILYRRMPDCPDIDLCTNIYSAVILSRLGKWNYEGAHSLDINQVQDFIFHLFVEFSSFLAISAKRGHGRNQMIFRCDKAPL